MSSRARMTLSAVLIVTVVVLATRVFGEPAGFEPRQVTPLSDAALAPRSHHTAVWTGTQMLVWGGDDGRRTFGDGAAYDPSRNMWPHLPRAPIQPRSHHSAAWTGKEMIIWGGTAKPTETGITPLGDAAAYNPASGRWRTIAQSPSSFWQLDARATAVPGMSRSP
ncbi:hypothetical protein HII36_45685 [Nonomuraea sp. NN258]|uniref:Kelch repeat-containing protein n=1 Tax=Nonomuraea antri TaxID=2730852 RepID=UPI0015695CBC|nr:kelch repeat-containing protein [Nonomuraea antri]NRQ39067.1 hypothetical protein [Nonomuraea antri]